MDLNDAYYFVQVVEKKGFTAAARALGIPKSRVSRRVKELESALGARLIQRSSRRMVVTEIGKEYYHHAREAVGRLEAAETSVRRRTNTVEGLVTVSCSVGMAQFALNRILPKFLEENPKVDIVLQASNQMVDLLEGRIDVAIRGHMDTLPDSSLIQVRLAGVEWHVFCSSEYHEKLGSLEEPDALADHPFLALGRAKESDQWVLEDDNGRSVTISCKVRLASDDMTTLKEAAKHGLGLVALPSYVCKTELEAGSLMRVLPKWTAGRPQISLLMPSRRGILPPVEAFVAYLKRALPGVLGAEAG